MSREAMKLALEALDKHDYEMADHILWKALEQPEPEPVAWLVTNHHINKLQIDSIQRLIDRAKHAHTTDIKLRINGQDEWYEADWLKHMTRTSPPKREWQGLTEREVDECYELVMYDMDIEPSRFRVYQAIEAKLKEKNT